MKKLSGLALGMLLALPTLALDALGADLLSCSAKAKDWSVTVALDENGQARTSLERGGVKRSCTMRIRIFEFNDTAVVRTMAFNFDRGECSPALSVEEEKQLLPGVALLLKKVDQGKPPQAQIQWHRTTQVAPCVLGKYEGQDLVRNHRKFKNGTWGR